MLRSLFLGLLFLSPVFAQAFRPQLEYVVTQLPIAYRPASRVIDLNNRGQALVINCDVIVKGESCSAVLWSEREGPQTVTPALCPLGSCAYSADDPAVRLGEQGDVMGRLTEHIFTWSGRQGLRLIARVNPVFIFPSVIGVTRQGEMVGNVINQPPIYQAVIASEKDGLRLLEGAYHSVARGVNEKLEVTGEARFTASSSLQAFYWTRKGGMFDIGSHIGARSSDGVAINEFGVVAGTMVDADGSQFLFLWERWWGLLAKVPLRSGCSPRGLNDMGQVTGGCSGFATPPMPWVWTARRGIRDIGTLGNGAIIYDQNNAGMVVGLSTVGKMTPAHAFMWSELTGTIDLDKGFPERLSDARTINEFGTIGGSVANRAAIWTARRK